MIKNASNINLQNQHIVCRSEKHTIFQNESGWNLVLYNNELQICSNNANCIVDSGIQNYSLLEQMAKLWLHNKYLLNKIQHNRLTHKGHIDKLNSIIEKVEDYDKIQLAKENTLLEKYIQQYDQQVTKLQEKIRG